MIFPHKQWCDFIESELCHIRCHRLHMRRDKIFDRILQRKEVSFYTSAHLSSSSSCLASGGGGGTDTHHLSGSAAEDITAMCLILDSSIAAKPVFYFDGKGKTSSLPAPLSTTDHRELKTDGCFLMRRRRSVKLPDCETPKNSHKGIVHIPPYRSLTLSLCLSLSLRHLPPLL